MAQPQNKGKKFSVDENGIKWFECEFENCEYRTKFSGNLSSHQRQHSEIEIRYVCSTCLYKFKTKEYLKQHVEREIKENDPAHAQSQTFGYILCTDIGKSSNFIFSHIISFSCFLLFPWYYSLLTFYGFSNFIFR